MGPNSTQICIIHIYIHVGINMYNEIQKERIFISNFRRAEDEFVGVSSNFLALEA